MNNQRRADIGKIADQISSLQSQIEALRDDEQNAYDSMPESLQGSEKGEKSQAAVDALDTAIESLIETYDTLVIEACA